MNQNQVKLIAIDMDGTLLNSQKEIPVENIKAIQEAAAAGIKIVLCTGRPRSGILPHFEKLGLSEEEYIIMNNGCSTYETKNWKLLQYESLSRSEMEELLQACEDFPEVALTLTGEKTYYVVGDEVPELVAYDAGTVFTEAKARSLPAPFTIASHGIAASGTGVPSLSTTSATMKVSDCPSAAITVRSGVRRMRAGSPAVFSVTLFPPASARSVPA